MHKITRDQFQAAIETGIDAAKIHGTDYAARLNELGRTATVTRVKSFGYHLPTKCPAAEVGLAAPLGETDEALTFACTFDDAVWILGGPDRGKMKIVDTER